MLSTLTLYILATLFVLGVLIFFHELGHFLMAKHIGIRVEKFSLGFGPKLVGIKRGETEYLISAFPLGGYVKLAGENPDEEVKGEPWEFASRSVWERIRVVICGPITNIMLAYILITLVFSLGRQIPRFYTEAPVIGWVDEGSAADKAGLQLGDRILNIDRQPMENWEDVYLFIKMAATPSHTFKLLVDRGGRRLNIRLTPEAEESKELGGLGFAHYMAPEVGQLTPGFPAEEAGLQVGDIITHIDNEPISHWLELSQIIHNRPEQELKLTVNRQGSTLTIPITPRLQEPSGIGLIGIAPPQPVALKRYGPVEAVRHGYQEVNELFGLTIEFLWRVLSGRASTKSIGGPIAIAQIAGEAAASGIADLFWVMGFISLQLGILNLLPIPILDGGLILFLLIEAVLRRPISLKKRELAQQIGLALIILLMIFAFYNDIMRLIVG
jgi:regulator of sigma E protease